jgi:hypothetical protein
MDRCVSDYKDVNHNPQIVLNGDDNAIPLDIQARPGERIVLNARGSDDPDDDSLFFNWWLYQEPSSYPGKVNIQNSSTEEVAIMVPEDSGGHALHIIFELSDNGAPPLKSYRRVVIHVQD